MNYDKNRFIESHLTQLRDAMRGHHDQQTINAQVVELTMELNAAWDCPATWADMFD